MDVGPYAAEGGAEGSVRVRGRPARITEEPARSQDTVHLGKRRLTVWYVEQAEIAQDDVEACIFELHCLGVTLDQRGIRRAQPGAPDAHG